jgi:hypothetical protein
LTAPISSLLVMEERFLLKPSPIPYFVHWNREPGFQAKGGE